MLNPADAAFAAHLARQLPEGTLRQATPAHLEEPRGRYRGVAGPVLAPASTQEVACIVRACAQARVGLVPYGGGTGLVGGQLLPDGPAPVILSLERMSGVRQVLARENVLVADAGAILADVQSAAAAADRLFPLSLASEGSARVGGCLATNAGGVNVLRYGNARDLCLGIEAVLPDGAVFNGLTRLRKDNTGYDLRNLLIGSEGTLGVITAATLRLFPRPASVGTALVVVPDPAAALDLLALAGQELGTNISAFELISGMGLRFLVEELPAVRQPFAQPPAWMVLIETGMAAGQDAQAALERLFVAALEQDLVLDGVIAQSRTQRAEFWSLREHIPEANRKIGSISSHDISVPLEAIPAFIDEGGARLAAIGAFRVNCFGHLGDGNLHYNVFPAPGQDRHSYEPQREAIKRCVHDLVAEMGGSVSAEHGIGRLKVADLQRYGDATKLGVMRAIKNALDPHGIMNPGAVLSTY